MAQRIGFAAMNPLTQVRNQRLLNERELKMGTANTGSSWHSMFKDSAWIYIGGLDFDLTEGDVICVFSQYGEVVNINLVRDQATGRSKGFAFLCYEDQRSTVLACDNLNGAKVVGRTLRVNHVESYKVKELIKPDLDPVRQHLREQGCAPGAAAAVAEAVSVAAAVAKEADSSPKRSSQSPPALNAKTDRMPVRVKRERIDPGYPDYRSRRSRSPNQSGNRAFATSSNRHRSRTRSRSPKRTGIQRSRDQASPARPVHRSRSRSRSPRAHSSRSDHRGSGGGGHRTVR